MGIASGLILDNATFADLEKCSSGEFNAELSQA